MKHRAVFLVLLLTSAEITYANQENRFVLYSNQAKGSAIDAWLTKVYRELYSEIGKQIEVVSIPEARASIKAETGKIDGQFGRIYEYQDVYPDQIRINVPLIKITLEAYVRSDSGIRLTSGWDSFRGTKHHVDYRRGVLICKQNLERVVKPSNLNTVTYIHQGLLKLKHARTDVFVQANNGVVPYLRSPEFSNDIVSAGKLESVNIYHYVNIKHRDLAPRIEQQLLQLKTSGKIKKYCIENLGVEQAETCESLTDTD
ncbi:hypothetical protein P7F88_04285 [Vibrio hannami]|uniref:hypothetical protein n=1 Tax=Vibrio hannami TaxID=2717094 RepID=UPI0024109967|nr:hypothetical protein [Vibrio hannami]MDG3085362.1 hypothetical protein [Vibrio hannami]